MKRGKFCVTILGNNSAAPAYERHPSSQIVNLNDKLFLIDCGEATQMQLKLYSIKFYKINHIFISHLHGDHYLGLMGLIFTFHLLERKETLFIYADSKLEKIITIQLEAANCKLVYPLVFVNLTYKGKKIIYDDEKLEIYSFPLFHNIPTCGFIFKEKPGIRNIKKDFANTNNIPFSEFKKIQEGIDYISPDGIVYKNNDITNEPSKPRTFAYCSDTAYDESLIEYIREIDLLYFEATFLNDKNDLAALKKHSTASQAALIAEKAKVKQLIIGHFSSRYKNSELSFFEDEARKIFEKTNIANEGETFEI